MGPQDRTNPDAGGPEGHGEPAHHQETPAAFTVVTSLHGPPYLEVTNDSSKVTFLTNVMTVMRSIDSTIYKKRVAAGAFLQGYDLQHGWALIEFWEPDYAPFVQYLNDAYPEFNR